MSFVFDPAQREEELRRESEQWDTHGAVPAGDGDIPVVDVAAWFASGSPRDLDEVARCLRAASETVGFHQLVGHGFDPALVDLAFDATRRFHDLPLDRKAAIAMDRPEWPLGGVGYLHVGNRKLPRRALGNQNEAFVVKSDIGVDFDANQWPDAHDVPGFRRIIERYADAVSALAVRLLPAYAVALDLAPDHFDEAFRNPFWRLRLSHYPARSGASTDGDYGIAPHVDTTFFTLLRHDAPGLTVFCAPRNEWIIVPVVDDAFVVNTGELLRQWTNDRFLSARHFADNRWPQSRYSIPFFFNADADHVMEPLPSCVGPDNPPRYPPVSYRQSQASVQGG